MPDVAGAGDFNPDGRDATRAVSTDGATGATCTIQMESWLKGVPET